MSSQGSKRPESFKDLPSWDRSTTLVDIALTDEALKGGVLVSANDLIDLLVQAYGRDAITVAVDGSALVVRRPHTDAELAARLAEAQRRWDERYGASA